MLDLLRKYLHLGAVEEDDPPEDPPANENDESLEALLGAPDPEPPPADDPAAELARERKIAKEAREELERERASRRLEDEARARLPARPTVDSEYEREEAQLAEARKAGQDTSMLEWTIKSNRTIREVKRESQQAVLEARDTNDRNDFDRVRDTNPKTYKAYKDRVEESVNKFRSNGQQPPPRRAILAFFIGQDALDGKIKPKTSKPAEPTATPGTKVDRGRTPGARSDVSAKGTLNEKQKRAERLRNQFI
jgi:hypothetical protein